MFIALLAACSFSIPTHLDQVQSRIETHQERSVLTPMQQVRRNAAVAHLRDYRAHGTFPHNHVLPEGRDRPIPLEGTFATGDGRTPVFVDEHDTPCAVAHLMRASGATELVETIRSTENTAFIHELADDDGVAEWVEDSGFSVDELARIQPSYCFAHPTGPLLVGEGLVGGAAVVATTGGLVQVARKKKAWAWLGAGAALSGGLLSLGALDRSLARCRPQKVQGSATIGVASALSALNVVGFAVAAGQRTVVVAPKFEDERVGLQVHGTL